MEKLRHPLLARDVWLLFATRSLRMFAYGYLSVVLVLFLSAEDVSKERIGFLLSLTLLGDTVLSLWITTAADRLGRKRMLIFGALLMAAAGAVFASTAWYPALLVAAMIGVLSPSDKEVGPFLAIEQAALSQNLPDQDRTSIFAWYHLVGSIAAALGTLAAGWSVPLAEQSQDTNPDIYRPIIVAYTVIGIVLAIAFTCLSRGSESKPVESPTIVSRWLGLHESRGVVLRLSALFALDAFGGGFIVQSLVAYWFHERFGLNLASIGSVLFCANLLAAASGLAAASLAKRFGLINTMVFTHLPSNILLILIPLMPNVTWAVTLFLLRFCISQMDVPTRQSYTMAVVRPDERSAASGITTVARSIGAAISPAIAGFLLADDRWLSVPFFIAGSVKIVYDLLLYRAFVTAEPKAD